MRVTNEAACLSSAYTSWMSKKSVPPVACLNILNLPITSSSVFVGGAFANSLWPPMCQTTPSARNRADRRGVLRPELAALPRLLGREERGDVRMRGHGLALRGRGRRSRCRTAAPRARRPSPRRSCGRSSPAAPCRRPPAETSSDPGRVLAVGIDLADRCSTPGLPERIPERDHVRLAPRVARPVRGAVPDDVVGEQLVEQCDVRRRKASRPARVQRTANALDIRMFTHLGPLSTAAHPAIRPRADHTEVTDRARSLVRVRPSARPEGIAPSC